jgi:hypothetical protein
VVSSFSSFDHGIGFVESKSDAPLFTLHRSNDTAYILLYVDDIILIASSASFLANVTSRIGREFSM